MVAADTTWRLTLGADALTNGKARCFRNTAPKTICTAFTGPMYSRKDVPIGKLAGAIITDQWGLTHQHGGGDQRPQVSALGLYVLHSGPDKEPKQLPVPWLWNEYCNRLLSFTLKRGQVNPSPTVKPKHIACSEMYHCCLPTHTKFLQVSRVRPFRSTLLLFSLTLQ